MAKSFCCEWKNKLSIGSPIVGLIFSDVNEIVLLCKNTSRKYYRASLGLTITTLILTIVFGLIQIIARKCECKGECKCKCKIDGKFTSSILALLGLLIIMLNTANLTVNSIEKIQKTN
jgi:hypothetical protein